MHRPAGDADRSSAEPARRSGSRGMLVIYFKRLRLTFPQILNSEKTEGEAAYRALVALGDIVSTNECIIKMREADPRAGFRREGAGAPAPPRTPEHRSTSACGAHRDVPRGTHPGRLKRGRRTVLISRPLLRTPKTYARIIR